MLEAKLAVDQLVDPTTVPAVVLTSVDRMTADVVRMVGENAGSAQKLKALRRYLYESGEWNGYRPFTYDLGDPLGEKPANRLLQRYLDTRQGNCITMPILLLALGQRLGLNMALAQAPLHVFIKYIDDAGSTWNLEATSGGGFTRDLWYRQKLPMSDAAVANGTYLRALTDDEAVALIASFLVEHHLAEGRPEAAISTADVILQHYPDFAYLLAKKGSAYSALLQRELAGKYIRTSDIPPDVNAKVDRWYQENLTAFAKAEALGWRPEDGQAP
ncbi:transglutaminase family protein [Rhizobium sp. CF080]|uniref:transglutaminase family protein n=1 Tax=Rhizobium sp. (strain CF080) TaxID=1144310 RepID=UPI0018CC2242|nr:transglutaminase family protein [Rhizobium sp. CF080]